MTKIDDCSNWSFIEILYCFKPCYGPMLTKSRVFLELKSTIYYGPYDTIWTTFDIDYRISHSQFKIAQVKSEID